MTAIHPRSLALAAAFLGFLIFGECCGDTVELDNGVTYAGRISACSGESIGLSKVGGGFVVVPMDRIVKLSAFRRGRHHFEVKLKSGARYCVGRVNEEGSRVTLTLTRGITITFARSVVESVKEIQPVKVAVSAGPARLEQKASHPGEVEPVKAPVSPGTASPEQTASDGGHKQSQASAQRDSEVKQDPPAEGQRHVPPWPPARRVAPPKEEGFWDLLPVAIFMVIWFSSMSICFFLHSLLCIAESRGKVRDCADTAGNRVMSVVLGAASVGCAWYVSHIFRARGWGFRHALMFVLVIMSFSVVGGILSWLSGAGGPPAGPGPPHTDTGREALRLRTHFGDRSPLK